MTQRFHIEKILFRLAILLIGFNTYAQKDSIYTDIKTARENPIEVYHLNLSGQNIRRQLKHLQEFHNLEYLDLSFCELDEFPADILSCKQLKSLIISSNSISLLPEKISNLAQLEVLNLAYNKINEIPETIEKCSRLRILDLSSNYQLKNIPPQLNLLNSLEYLSCKASKNEFTNIVCGISSLKELVIYSSSSDLICDLIKLKELKSFKLILIETEFTPFECSLNELAYLNKMSIEKLDCCWPYIEIPEEIENSIKSLLPAGCELLGFIRQNTEIKSDIELR